MFVSCFGRFRLTISELDCEQSLFPSDLVRVVHARATRVVICVSRAFCSTDQKKRDCSQSIPELLPGFPSQFFFGYVHTRDRAFITFGGGGGLRGYSFVKGLILGGQFWAGLLCKSCRTML